MDPYWFDWPAVALIGGIVGASELISRYKDDPGAAIKSWPAILYIAINAAASVAALGLIGTAGWFAASHWTRILLAGVSAMAFFRTSLFVIRAGERDVGIGPSGFLQIFLAAADRAVDRRRATARSDAVAKVMKNVDFDKAVRALPPYCVGLMQNVSPEDQQVLGRALQDLESREEDPALKALLLGLELMNVVGVDVLTTAVNSLGDQIRSAPKAPGA
jgi:hypothetical protein